MEIDKMEKQITPTKALLRFMGRGKHGRRMSSDELKALSPEDREELGQMALKEISE